MPIIIAIIPLLTITTISIIFDVIVVADDKEINIVFEAFFFITVSYSIISAVAAAANTIHNVLTLKSQCVAIFMLVNVVDHEDIISY